MTEPWPACAAVVGGGLMGSAIAHLLASAGIPTRICDRNLALAVAARERALAVASDPAQRRGSQRPDDQDLIASRLSAASSLEEAVQSADFILEAVIEDEQEKREVLARAEAAAAAHAVLASNTSAIPIRRLCAALQSPERFLGTHWFHPANWIPCVEVIPSEYTQPEAIEQVTTLLTRLGKRPVAVKDSAGFVANRIQCAMFREAAAVVAEGVADAEAVDTIISNSIGFRLPAFGPFAIADMAGLDVYMKIYGSLVEAFGDRLTAPRLLEEQVAEGRLGVKSQQGFTRIASSSPEVVTRLRDKAYARLTQALAEDHAAIGASE